MNKIRDYSRAKIQIKTSSMLKNSQCIFIISQGRSGSTLLMRLLNSIEGYNICGENHGSLIELHQFYQKIVQTIVIGHTVCNRKRNQLSKENKFLTYEELLAKPKASQNYSGQEWYNVFDFESIQEKLRELIVEMFDPKRAYRVWGCKEIKYGTGSYEEFENDLNFLKELFPFAKFIFNTRNLEDTVKSAWWASDPESSREILTQKNNYYLKYHQKYPTFTYHIPYEDLIGNTDLLQGMYRFLGESFDIEKYRVVLGRR